MLPWGSRHCGLQTDTAQLHAPPWESCGAAGQEHHDMRGRGAHVENNPAPPFAPSSLTPNEGNLHLVVFLRDGQCLSSRPSEGLEGRDTILERVFGRHCFTVSVPLCLSHITGIPPPPPNPHHSARAHSSLSENPVLISVEV